MTAFPFAAPDILHFRFNVGLVYLGPLNHFKSNYGVILQKWDALTLNSLFSNSYMGLTGQHHPLSYMT